MWHDTADTKWEYLSMPPLTRQPAPTLVQMGYTTTNAAHTTLPSILSFEFLTVPKAKACVEDH